MAPIRQPHHSLDATSSPHCATCIPARTSDDASAARSQSNLRSRTPQTHCYRCVGADPVVRACVIPSLSRNCIAISAQARIGSSSAHFTSNALSPCSTRKWAALVGDGPSLRGLPAGGCGACPVVAVVPPGCGGGEGMAPGADGRGPLDGGCGGCAKATVANMRIPIDVAHHSGMMPPAIPR
jgi:hypothetical protein